MDDLLIQVVTSFFTELKFSLSFAFSLVRNGEEAPMVLERSAMLVSRVIKLKLNRAEQYP